MKGFKQAAREAQEFALSLHSEGYYTVVSVRVDKWQLSYIKLRHRTNKNIIVVQAQGNTWLARKNGKKIKSVTESE